MLLFEDAGKEAKRKWQCFVCGKQHDNYDSYKIHILENHEEGREYLKCPSCDAPVRDMRSHFTIKHKNRLMPKGIQMRVGVWHDFKPSGKKKTRKPHFNSGEFDSRKNGAMIKYRSGVERDFYEQLESDLDVVAYQAEPFKVPYCWQGEWHNYIPDLRVDFTDHSIEIWEIKPANQTEYEQNQCKWAAMKNFAEHMGWEFVVQTPEVALGKLKAKIRRQRKLNEST
jgi:hypothetical protein